MLDVLDAGTHFEMIDTDNNRRVAIEFGEFSLLVANVDYHMIRNRIQKEVVRARNSFTQDGRYAEEHKNALNELGITAKQTWPKFANKFFAPLFALLDIDCLDSSQLIPVTDLFLSEIIENMQLKNPDCMDKNFNFFSLLLYDELKEHLESILLHESTNFSEEIATTLSQVNMSSSAKIDVDGNIQTTYHIDSVRAFLVLDLMKYIKYPPNKKTIVRCQNPECRRLFYRDSRKVKYCQLGHLNSKDSCPEIVRRKPKNEFDAEAKKAQLAQYRYLQDAEENKGHDYDYVELTRLYKKWLCEYTEQRDYYRSINDIEGYRKWIADTMLSPAHLEEMGIRKPIAKRAKKGR